MPGPSRGGLMCSTIVVLVTVLAFGIVTAPAAPAAKVQVCHRPPGNPANYHTITIGAEALSAHLAHGDLPGPCAAQCEDLCDDGNACTIHAGTWDPSAERCVCSNRPVNCDDGNVCTVDSCNPAIGCVNTPQAGLPCDDGNACTTGDVCNAAGACVGGTQVAGCCQGDADCSNGNSCQPQVCEANTCVAHPVSCQAPDACTVGACDPATGCVLSPVVCQDDGNPCTAASCDPAAGCVPRPLTGPSCDAAGQAGQCVTGVCLPIDPGAD